MEVVRGLLTSFREILEEQERGWTEVPDLSRRVVRVQGLDGAVGPGLPAEVQQLLVLIRALVSAILQGSVEDYEQQIGTTECGADLDKIQHVCRVEAWLRPDGPRDDTARALHLFRTAFPESTRIILPILAASFSMPSVANSGRAWSHRESELRAVTYARKVSRMTQDPVETLLEDTGTLTDDADGDSVEGASRLGRSSIAAVRAASQCSGEDPELAVTQAVSTTKTFLALSEQVLDIECPPSGVSQRLQGLKNLSRDTQLLIDAQVSLLDSVSNLESPACLLLARVIDSGRRLHYQSEELRAELLEMRQLADAAAEQAQKQDK